MATKEYDRNNCTRINLKLNNRTDADIIEKLGTVENIQGYIKAVVRNQMEGEVKMKKFERITGELYGAKKAGFVLDKDAERETNEQLARVLIAERGEKFVDSKLDAFHDFDGDLYRDEDGQEYAVEMVWVKDKEEPLCWQRLRRA